MSNRSPRGYLLLEVMIAAAITATMLGTVMYQLEYAQTKTLRTEREQLAQMLVVQRVEQARAYGFAALNSTTSPPYGTTQGAATTETITSATVPGLTGIYTRRTWVTQSPAATPTVESVNGLALEYVQVTVEVSFSVHDNPATVMQKSTVRIFNT